MHSLSHLLFRTRVTTWDILTCNVNAAASWEQFQRSQSIAVISSSFTVLGVPIKDENRQSRIYIVHQIFLHRSTMFSPSCSTGRARCQPSTKAMRIAWPIYTVSTLSKQAKSIHLHNSKQCPSYPPNENIAQSAQAPRSPEWDPATTP